MKFFVDTADVAEIRDLAATGLLDGVTTNPSLIMKSGRDFLEVIAEICEIVPGPVSAEVAATTTEGMLAEAARLTPIAPNVTIKVPLTWDGLRATKRLSGEGVKVNVTLCFTAAQALLAAKAGATFVSPFVGRLDDIGLDGLDLISDICQIYDQYDDLQTEVLVASVRSPGPRHRSGQDGCPRGYPAAARAPPAGTASPDRQGPCRLPQGLGGDRPENRLRPCRTIPARCSSRPNCASEAEARRVARDAVEAGLAACANTHGPATAIYRWRGGIAEEAEWVVQLKTGSTRVAAIEALIGAQHTY